MIDHELLLRDELQAAFGNGERRPASGFVATRDVTGNPTGAHFYSL